MTRSVVLAQTPYGWIQRQAREFVAGTTQPSLPSVLGAICTAALCFLACMWLITPQFVAAGASKYIVMNARDDSAHITAKVLGIQQSSWHGVSLVAIGDSMLREAVTSEEVLHKLLSKKTGRNVAVHLLTGGGFSHWHAMGLADCVRDRVRGVVLLEISLYNLSLPPAAWQEVANEQRLALDSPAFDEEGRQLGMKVPHRHSNYFLNHFWFFAARTEAVLNALTGPVPYAQHFAGESRRWMRDRLLAAQSITNKWERRYERNRDVNLAAYGRIIQHLRERNGITVVLLEGVQNPDNLRLAKDVATSKRIRDQYRADVSRFAKEANVPHWDLSEAADLRPTDFEDPSHISSPAARCRYTEVLAARVAELLQSQSNEVQKQ
ncbi:MAG: SGNH/GDSL hydrolase family protein [Bacillota bacterium]